jgi:hypothetical protein
LERDGESRSHLNTLTNEKYKELSPFQSKKKNRPLTAKSASNKKVALNKN